ncbi:hypothetical protein B296_00016806 [Ensete ventricosum]|uniref:Uncharacterized protein n=1 Tax=Ensete ventricosum TaxID=4639 RepID=A0A427AHJ1_ENSVE|nr:hypothetical protein B296_00016806 [Ensete ventricosum]
MPRCMAREHIGSPRCRLCVFITRCTAQEHVGLIEVQVLSLHAEVHTSEAPRMLNRVADLKSSCQGARLGEGTGSVEMQSVGKP